MEYDFVFIVLVYRNTQDLKDFFNNFSLVNSKVIVVNSYFDEDTKDEFEKIAYDNDADFLNVPNKGYGSGNNRGCEYAIANYKFKYLVISNADIIIRNMSIDDISHIKNEIIAPDIRDLNGIKQNPHLAFRMSKTNFHIRKHLYKCNSPYIDLIFAISSRIQKSLFYTLHRFFKRNIVYAAHGAFFIMPYNVLRILFPLYDENIFLFGEETHLGLKAEHANIKTRYLDKIKIIHKEDGSVKLENINTFQSGRKSFEYIYQYWFGKNKNHD